MWSWGGGRASAFCFVFDLLAVSGLDFAIGWMRCPSIRLYFLCHWSFETWY